MKITDIFIHRPVLALVVSLLIIIAGLQAVRSLNVRQYPRSENSAVTITTVYVGASAELIRGFITTPLERAIAAADGIDYIQSQSSQGVSTISARLKLNYDPIKALSEISSKVDQIRGDLPPEAEVPTINVESADSQFASAYLSFTSEILRQNQITDFLVRSVQPRLSAIEGVQRADIVVNGAGRQADIDDLGLDRAGVEHSRKGIIVNTRMQTTQTNIYAIGDCAATIQLARVADYEAMVAASTILSEIDNGIELEIDYSAIPAILFTYPQYAMVGYTEDALKLETLPYIKSFGQNLTWPTYRRIGMPSAAFKILAGTNGEFLGAHILSDNASGIVNTIRLAILNRIPVETLYQQSIMSPYPSRESDMPYMLKSLITKEKG